MKPGLPAWPSAPLRVGAVTLSAGDNTQTQREKLARIVLDAMKFDAEYVPCDIGWEFWCREGNALPDRTIKALQGTTCGLFGAITSNGITNFVKKDLASFDTYLAALRSKHN